MTLGQGKSKVVNLVFRFPSAPSSEAVNAGQWRLSATGLDPVAVRIGTLADEPYFHYNKELGVIFGADTITERVFAPYAASASVLLKTSLSSEDVSVLPMKNAGHGVWECELPKAALGQYYRIRVNSGGKVTEGIDPYSRCNTAHAAELRVKEGDTVTRGQRIASVGTTGRSTGPHLHYEVWLNGKPVNPVPYLKVSAGDAADRS